MCLLKHTGPSTVPVAWYSTPSLMLYSPQCKTKKIGAYINAEGGLRGTDIVGRCRERVLLVFLFYTGDMIGCLAARLQYEKQATYVLSSRVD